MPGHCIERLSSRGEQDIIITPLSTRGPSLQQGVKVHHITPVRLEVEVRGVHVWGEVECGEAWSGAAGAHLGVRKDVSYGAGMY
jgi:hypothetical protein